LGFRSFLEQLDREGELTKIGKEVSTEYEMAGIIDALGEKPVFFEKVKESDILCLQTLWRKANAKK
jgi:UbiD family decarboxylase